MSCEYKEYIFDDRANKFFPKALNYGHELDRQLIDQINFNEGKVTAFLPDIHSQEVIYRFSGGGVASRSKSIECIVDTVENFLMINTNRICILEDSLSHPYDKFENYNGVSILTLKDEVYFFIENKCVNKEKIEYAITEAEQPNFFVGILSSTSSENSLPFNGSISSEHIKIFAKRAEKVILGAYDGEGYLIWSR